MVRKTEKEKNLSLESSDGKRITDKLGNFNTTDRTLDNSYDARKLLNGELEGEEETSYIEEVYNSNYNVFVYFDNEFQLQSNFIKIQIDTIGYHQKNRKIFVLWKDNEIKELFSKKYPYFNKLGHVRNEQSLEDIVELMKKSLEE